MNKEYLQLPEKKQKSHTKKNQSEEQLILKWELSDQQEPGAIHHKIPRLPK